jgi:hypothetical protein
VPQGEVSGPSLSAGLGGIAVPELGALGIVLIGVASLAVTLLRRHRMRRRLATRIADRLAAFVAGSSPVQPALAPAAAGPATSGPPSDPGPETR